MRTQARLSALLAYLAFGRRLALIVRSSPNADQAKLHAASPYICDGYVYNPTTLPITNPDEPFLTQRGDPWDGYPRVYMTTDQSELVIHNDCSFTYSDRTRTLSRIYFRPSLFNIKISTGYSVSLSFNVKQGAASQWGTGMIVWMRGEARDVSRRVSLHYLPDQKNHSTRGFFQLHLIEGLNYSEYFRIADTNLDCRLPVAKDNLQVNMTAFVYPRNSFFIFVLDVAGVHIVLHRRLSFITEDKDSEFVGIEVHTAREVHFNPLVVQPWHPTSPLLPITPVVECRNYMKEVVAFGVGLLVMLVLIVWQIVWASKHGRSNYTRGNQPRVIELVVSGIAGLQYFALIGQGVYMHISIAMIEGEADLVKQGGSRYGRFLYTTLGFIVFDTLYNGAVAYGAMAVYRDKLKYDLLRRHWLAYSLLAVMCLTNLELLTLFPWDYSKFPLAAHLDGYPSPIVAQLSSLPTVLQNVPVFVIQVLAQGCQPPHERLATDILLYVILGITMTDTCSHFALQLLPTFEAEKRYLETLPIVESRDRRGTFRRLRSTISTLSTRGLGGSGSGSGSGSGNDRNESSRGFGGQWGLLRVLLAWGGRRREGPTVRGAEDEEEEEEEGGKEGSQSQVLLQIQDSVGDKEVENEKEEEGQREAGPDTGTEGVEEMQEPPPPMAPRPARVPRVFSPVLLAPRSANATPTPDRSAMGPLADSAMEESHTQDAQLV